MGEEKWGFVIPEPNRVDRMLSILNCASAAGAAWGFNDWGSAGFNIFANPDCCPTLLAWVALLLCEDPPGWRELNIDIAF